MGHPFDALRAFCRSLAGTEETEPWGPGEYAFKLHGRSYAFVTRREASADVSAKPDPDHRDAWLAIDGVAPAPYVGRFGWLHLAARDQETVERAQHLIWESYERLTQASGRARRQSKASSQSAVLPGPPDTRVLRAAAEDVFDLAVLRWEHWLEEAHIASGGLDVDAVPPERGRFLEAFRTQMEPELAAGAVLAWIARRGPSPVGSLWIRPVAKIPWPPAARRGVYGYVTGVYVRPEARRHGVGRALVQEAQGQAAREGWEFLVLWPSDASRTWYRRQGFAPGLGEDRAWLWRPTSNGRTSGSSRSLRDRPSDPTDV